MIREATILDVWPRHIDGRWCAGVTDREIRAFARAIEELTLRNASLQAFDLEEAQRLRNEAGKIAVERRKLEKD